MNYNQRNDYRVTREIALGWWKTMPRGSFLVQGIAANAKPVNPEGDTCEPTGPWVIVTRAFSDLAAVVVQPLTDNSGDWGLAVLWYDREKSALFSRLTRPLKLSRSKEAARLIRQTLLQQGGKALSEQIQMDKPA